MQDAKGKKQQGWWTGTYIGIIGWRRIGEPVR